MKNTSLKLALVGIALISIVIGFFLLPPKKTTDKHPGVDKSPEDLIETKTENEIVEVTSGVLNALSSYNMSTIDTRGELRGGDEILKMMNDLMNNNRYLEEGDSFIKKYSKSDNEVIRVTMKGMLTGSKAVQLSTNNLIQYLRRIDENNPTTWSDLKYLTAKYLSDNKDGYKLIAISAPQITSLMWEASKTDNPTGKIPYTITKEERRTILKEIDRLFGNDLKQYELDLKNEAGSFDAIIFSVKVIKDNITPETYEEAKKLK